MSEQGCLCGAQNEDCERLIDVFTPFLQVIGGRRYRLLFETVARQVLLSDGSNVETRLKTLERALSAFSTTRFAENIYMRDSFNNQVVEGDRCYVFDAGDDENVEKGGAMYLWHDGAWELLYDGDVPLDVNSLIKADRGLAIEDGRLVIDLEALLAPDGFLEGQEGRAGIDLAALIQALAGFGLALSGGKLAVDAASLAGAGLGVDEAGKLCVDEEQAVAWVKLVEGGIDFGDGDACAAIAADLPQGGVVAYDGADAAETQDDGNGQGEDGCKCLAVKTGPGTLRKIAGANEAVNGARLSALEALLLSGGAAWNTEEVIDESCEWTSPIDGPCEVLCIGGGEGSYINGNTGWAGNSGEYVRKLVRLVKGEVVEITVGAGGIGAIAPAGALPISGGTTIFKDVVARSGFHPGSSSPCLQGTPTFANKDGVVALTGGGFGAGYPRFKEGFTDEEVLLHQSGGWWGAGAGVTVRPGVQSSVGNGHQGVVILRYSNQEAVAAPDDEENENG